MSYFNGTEQRKPMGMVEASLVFSDVAPQELEPVSALVEGIGANDGCHDHPSPLS